jgi:Ricin-type beta-trefoil lectin domain
MMSTFVRAFRARAKRRGDDEGSLIFALLVVVVGMLMTALMTPMLLTQLTATTNTRRLTQELAAAETGVDIMMGHIRAANDGAGNGVLGSLPCGTLTGSVEAAATERYQATVVYYKNDPTGQSSSWLASSTNQVQCIVGGGAISAPAFAMITSVGTNQPSGFPAGAVRTVQATYIFKTSNANIPGGAIHVLQSSVDMCLDAGSGNPAVGTIVKIQTCTPGAISQKFAYNANLTIELSASVTNSQPNGLCLDAGANAPSGAMVAFQLCSQTTLPQQQWSFDDNANFRNTLPDDSDIGSLCFAEQIPNTAGSLIMLSSSCGGGFSADASVGAGAAGGGIGNLVNFQEFGRCMDVTNQDPTSSFIIIWPCKQNPNPAKLTWNQLWALPAIATNATSATGRITTYDTANSTLYCLKSPGSTAAMQYAVVTPCGGTTPANETWTVYGNTGDYSTSYIIKDSSTSPGPYCLQPTDPSASPPDFFSGGSQVSKLVLGTCNGNGLQKWNAPPGIQQPTPLKNYSEK